MELLKNYILQFYPDFPSESLETGLALFKRKTFKANTTILNEGEVCDFLFFAEESITKCFYLNNDEEEEVVWIEPEGIFLTDFESFTQGTPSQYNLLFYQTTDVWMISREVLLSLYENDHNWAIFGIKIMEFMQNRLFWLFMALFRNDASKNYAFIEEHFLPFLRIVPLKDIASMLHVSPVSISRIRAGSQRKE